MNLDRCFIAGIDCLVAEPEGSDSSTQTVLCLHGIGGDDASFQPQLVELSSDYRVISWNMPGYRQSTVLPSLSFKVLAERVQSLIKALKHGPVHLIGQSIGGMIAQEVVHQFPELVKSVVLVATTSAFGGRDDSFKQAFLAARLKPLDEGVSMAQIASDAIPSIVAKHTDAAVIRSAVDSMAAVQSGVYRDVLSCLVTFNRREEWSNISCPVLLVAGSEDTNAPASTMKKMSDKLDHAEYHAIAGAGHLVNLEKGSEFNRLAAQFIKRHFEKNHD